MRKFLNLFLTTGIPFGLLWGIWKYFSFWSKKGTPLSICIYSSIFAGVLFGLLSVVSTVFSERYFLRKIGKNSKAIAAKQIQIKEFTLNISTGDALKKAKEALQRLGAKVQRFDKEKGVIVAKTGMSWKSWGRKLTVTVIEDNKNVTRIKIESKSPLVTLTVDFGKNLEDVDKIHKFIIMGNA